MGRHESLRQIQEVLMRKLTTLKPVRYGGGLAAAMLISASLCSTPAAALDEGAGKILKAMSDYLAGQKAISLTFDSDIEVLTENFQKIQFTSSGQVQLSRPNMVRATRTGGYTDVELTFDGKTATVLGKHINAYAQADASGSVDDLIHRLRDELSISMPGADLLVGDVFGALTADTVEGAHIGQGVIDGIECEHLAFRNDETDWQIWVEIGPRPIPRKYVITSKGTSGAPQYTVRIKDLKTDATPADAFAFKPPAGAKKVELSALDDVDEIPRGVPKGAKK
jgi:hypothetical protein